LVEWVGNTLYKLHVAVQALDNLFFLVESLLFGSFFYYHPLFLKKTSPEILFFFTVTFVVHDLYI